MSPAGLDVGAAHKTSVLILLQWAKLARLGGVGKDSDFICFACLDKPRIVYLAKQIELISHASCVFLTDARDARRSRSSGRSSRRTRCLN